VKDVVDELERRRERRRRRRRVEGGGWSMLMSTTRLLRALLYVLYACTLVACQCGVVRLAPA
jgi:hypothetical protein